MLNGLIACRSRKKRDWIERIVTFLSVNFIVLLVAAGCSSIDSSDSRQLPTRELSPEEQLKTFQIDAGLKVELVAAEPLVQDPVLSIFDEHGRLWVVEMRAYMPDVDGDGERNPIGRVSVLEDTDDDGRMDRSTVYMDSLIMPRALAIVNDGVLVAYEEALWMTIDKDGDLKADERTLIDRDYAGSDLPEHAGNGLWRGIDNWYYNAKSRLRYKFRDGNWIRDSTEFRGQWGISHDDVGRLYYNYNWSQLHADLVPPNYFTRNKNHTPVSGIDQGLTLEKRVYPIRPTPAVNRGYIPGILDEEKKLVEFTAACSPFVYRGNALPEKYYGDVFVCEPSANLIKRNVLSSEGLHLNAHDPNPGTEFFASTDERFRPVHIAQGPDGAMYVVDMYRGLIQHKAYLTPYLREQTLERNLNLPIHRGRIWRIVPHDAARKKSTPLAQYAPMELLDFLSSDDGWYRDMAQRLLVERNDPAVIPALTTLALKGTHELGRFHALWTLEGMQALETEMLFELISDASTLVSTTAIRLLEPFANKDARTRQKLQTVLLREWEHAPDQKVLQMAFAASALEQAPAHELLIRIATHYDTSALIRDAILSSIGNEEFVFMRKLLASKAWQEQKASREIFLESLVSSIVRKGDATEMNALLSMLNVQKEHFGWREKTILTGMSIQGYAGKVAPLKVRAEPAILQRSDLGIPETQKQGVAALFEWPGSIARDTTKHQGIVLNEREKEQYALGRKLYLGTCSGCHGNDGDGLNRFAPPLRGSEWVTGDATRLTLIVIHGIEGPLVVAGKRYAEPEILPVMPAHSTLDDGTVAAILTYIRNSWGNEAEPVSRKTVGQVRITTPARTMPWTVDELETYIQELQTPKNE